VVKAYLMGVKKNVRELGDVPDFIERFDSCGADFVLYGKRKGLYDIIGCSTENWVIDNFMPPEVGRILKRTSLNLKVVDGAFVSLQNPSAVYLDDGRVFVRKDKLEDKLFLAMLPLEIENLISCC